MISTVEKVTRPLAFVSDAIEKLASTRFLSICTTVVCGVIVLFHIRSWPHLYLPDQIFCVVLFVMICVFVFVVSRFLFLLAAVLITALLSPFVSINEKAKRKSEKKINMQSRKAGKTAKEKTKDAENAEEKKKKSTVSKNAGEKKEQSKERSKREMDNKEKKSPDAIDEACRSGAENCSSAEDLYQVYVIRS